MERTFGSHSTLFTEQANATPPSLGADVTRGVLSGTGAGAHRLLAVRVGGGARSAIRDGRGSALGVRIVPARGGDLRRDRPSARLDRARRRPRLLSGPTARQRDLSLLPEPVGERGDVRAALHGVAGID